MGVADWLWRGFAGRVVVQSAQSVGDLLVAEMFECGDRALGQPLTVVGKAGTDFVFDFIDCEWGQPDSAEGLFAGPRGWVKLAFDIAGAG